MLIRFYSLIRIYPTLKGLSILSTTARMVYRPSGNTVPHSIRCVTQD